MSLEPYLIEQCAPTLASIKTANLFRVPYPSEPELQGSMDDMRDALASKGIFLETLKKDAGHALLYLYRRERLRRDLGKEEVAEFLRRNGYMDCSPETAVRRLKERFAKNQDFPHEVGLFLSYPLTDVIGFIENKGRNCKYCGFWKVYGDERAARKKFAQYRKCQEIYRRRYAEGTPLWRLTVAQKIS